MGGVVLGEGRVGAVADELQRIAGGRAVAGDVDDCVAAGCPTLNTKVSLPALPVSVSVPPWPSSTLSPEFPKIELASALPVPLALANPCSARCSTFADRTMCTVDNTTSVPSC